MATPTDGVHVECHAGYQASEEPRVVLLDGRRLRVLGIAKRWYEPGASSFHVRLDDGHRYLLRYDQRRDRWSAQQLESAQA